MDVIPSEDKIEMHRVYLKSEEDIKLLNYLVTQYKVWSVTDGLYLTDLGPDDWTLLAELVKTLDRVGWVKITSNSTSHIPQEFIRELWNKTTGLLGYFFWVVNNEKYKKSEENFDIMYNKYFK